MRELYKLIGRILKVVLYNFRDNSKCIVFCVLKFFCLSVFIVIFFKVFCVFELFVFFNIMLNVLVSIGDLGLFFVVYFERYFM